MLSPLGINKLKFDVEQKTKNIVSHVQNLQTQANSSSRAGLVQVQERTRRAVPGTRASMLGGFFDLIMIIPKSNQAAVNMDGRSGIELGTQLIQSVGSWHTVRAQAFEVTIYKGIQTMDVYKQKAVQQGFDQIKVAHLRALKVTAFKFLGPAAAISAVLDIWDSQTSDERGLKGLRYAQIASAFGSVLTAAGIGAGIYGLSATSAAAWATAAAILGIAGAVLTVVAVVAIMILSEEDWVTWLRDNPLRKEIAGDAKEKKPKSKPIHENLQDTLQKLADSNALLKAG